MNLIYSDFKSSEAKQTMREKMIFLILLIAVVLIPSASATTITFNTSGTFVCEGAPFIGNPGCGTNVISFGTIKLTIFGDLPQTVDTPADTTFGDFVIGCLDGTTTCGLTTFASNTLAVRMNINQTSPTAANGNIPDAQIATASGGNVIISGNSSNGELQWNAGKSVTFGTIQYSKTNNPISLNPPNTNFGDTGIAGSVTDLPEPATLTLLGAGLVGLAFVRHRRKA